MKVPNADGARHRLRIKIMSNLDIAERRLPQDGKIKFRRKGVPAFEVARGGPANGRRFRGRGPAAARLRRRLKVDEMGLNERNLTVIKRVVAKPYGLVLAVGPTRSGKTTTLHAILGHINKPGVKIWTAEDPIEITQQGLRQVEVKPKIGLDFARVMRAFLRADPDVIMIGEMRDEETASIAIEASLTGHLVFSTLHTNSAPETVTRLLDMGLNARTFPTPSWASWPSARPGGCAATAARDTCSAGRSSKSCRCSMEEYFGRTGLNTPRTSSFTNRWGARPAPARATGAAWGFTNSWRARPRSS